MSSTPYVFTFAAAAGVFLLAIVVGALAGTRPKHPRPTRLQSVRWHVVIPICALFALIAALFLMQAHSGATLLAMP